MFRLTRSPMTAPDDPAEITLSFKDAIPVGLTEGGETIDDPLALFERLNTLGGEHGIGRIDIVENRFVGIKSRGVYETPGATILHHAIRDLEGIAMDARSSGCATACRRSSPN